MTVASFFYQLLIGPIEIIFETIFGFSWNVLDNYGLSIIVMSLAMNLLLLPFYLRADDIQNEEREAEERMADGVTHIKKTFKGDERFMMLQTYYRENNYKPYYTLKGFLPLVLEIPFFIAAYHFLSNYLPQVGGSFGPIRNLGESDGMLSIAGVSLNLLPVLMTAINCISSAIYTKGYPLRSKIQLYAMALVFLVLLYGSPSGLVLYWTLNNLFSLVKNLTCRIKNYRLFLTVAMAVIGTALFVYALRFYQTSNPKHRLLFILVALMMLLPSACAILVKLFRIRVPSIPRNADPRLFVCAAVFMAVLTGILIPSAVIRSSPQEFVHLAGYYSPLRHLLNASLLSFGFFVVWLGIFYYMLKDRARWVFALALWLIAGVAVVDYMFFGTDLGLITAELKFEVTPIFTSRDFRINLLVLLALMILLFLIYLKRQKLALGMIAVLLIAVSSMSAVNAWKIQSSMAGIRTSIDSEDEQVEFTLSREGKNVVFIMLDRAIGVYLPYIFEEKPELAQQYAGFTYYPNTLSFGSHTISAAPALWGGYEYTPDEINKRSGELMVDKHDEALKVMPVLFSEEGYQVTVCDPPLAGYKWIPDLSVFDGYDGIRSYYMEQGGFDPSYGEKMDQLWKRNFFCYSIMKCVPLVIQVNVYDDGAYYGSVESDSTFSKSFMALKAFTSVTHVVDGDENTFLALCNSTPHAVRVLTQPDYEPSSTVNLYSFSEEERTRSAEGLPTLCMDTDKELSHYHVNMAALMKLGDWLDYLREQGVYDNTRIIISSDHGYYVDQFPELLFTDSYQDDVIAYNPLLLVKDFNSSVFTTDPSFMTNADVPTLAAECLIADPVNPFTGEPICSDAKEASEQLIFTTHDFDPASYTGYTFHADSWYTVHDDIFDLSNWTRAGYW